MTTDHHDKIFDHNRQQLSALVDGALPADEARFLLRRLEHDEALAQCLSRWQLCGDILRGHAHAPAPAGFAQRVALAVAHDGPVPRRAERRAGARWGSGLALAASVAVVALFVARQSPDAGSTAPAQVVASQAEATPGDSGIGNGNGNDPLVAQADAGSDSAIARQATPQPAPTAPDTAAALTTVAAVAELPRRAAARRSRGQAQRAAATQGARRAAAEPQRAVASATPGPAAGTGPVVEGTNPFALRPEAVSGRPWPRALVPAATADGFTVDYGRQATARPFYPFQPDAVVPVLQPPLAQDPSPGERDAATEVP